MRTVRLGVVAAPGRQGITGDDLRALAGAIVAASGTRGMAIEQVYPDLDETRGTLLVLVRGGIRDEVAFRRSVAALIAELAPDRYLVTE